MWDAEVDVVVAGAGGSGLVAALSIAQDDLEVAVFEKTDFILGNTAASAGMIPAAGTRFQRELGIEETPKEMMEDILKKNNNKSDEDLTFALCQSSADLIEWINDDLNIELNLVKEFKYPGHRNLRMHAPNSKSGLELMKKLKLNVEKYDNLYLMLKSEVIELILNENGDVIGVKVKSNDKEQRIKAKKVILTTNGFGANKEMVGEYIPEMKEALYFGYEANTGDGINMALKIGAATENMNGYQGHSAINEGSGILVTWGTIMMGGLMVNNSGQRFGNESKGYSEFATELLEQEDREGYIIFDQEINDQLLTHEDFKKLHELNAFKEAETIEQLADEFGINADNLKRTFKSFSNNVDGQKDEFERTSFAKKLKPPFKAIKVSPALFHTQGGLKINKHAQVLDQKGNIIENLYAAGGTAVGVSGNDAFGYMSGNGLLAALGFGKIAGDHAAAEINLKRS